MEQLIGSLLFVLAEIVVGYSLLAAIYHNEKRIPISLKNIALSYLLGCGFSSLMILIFDMIGIRLTFFNIGLGTIIITASLLSYLLVKRSFKFTFSWAKVSVYDWIAYLIVLFFGIISIWRTFYYPPYSYDSTIGIDLLAKYAVSDLSISDSRLFQELLPFYKGYTNQLFYAPFVALMQILTQSIGIDYGQIWLGYFSMFFGFFFYSVIKENNHPAFAMLGLLSMLFVPEFFAYSFILQTDYSNAIFFFLGVYFFGKYIEKPNHQPYFVLSIVGMFFACWSRSETIFFIPFGSLFLLIKYYQRNKSINLKAFYQPVIFTLIPLVAVILWSFVYIKLYLPNEIDLGKQIDPDFSKPIFQLIQENIEKMNNIVIFQDVYWNYTVTLFLIFLLLSLIFSFFLSKNKLYNYSSIFWLFTLYLSFHILLLVFPAVSIENTFRRGFFKLTVLMSFYIGSNNFSKYLWVKFKNI